MSVASNILLGKYIAGSSPLHRLDARAKLLLLIVYLIALFVVDAWGGLLLFTLLLAVAIASSRINIKFLLRGVVPVLWLIIAVALFHIFFTKGGEQIFVFGIATIESNGLVQAGITSLRLFLLVMAASLFTLTTPIMSAAMAIEKLLSPLSYIKVPTAEIGLMLALSFRFIPILLEESERLTMAQKARGREIAVKGRLERTKDLLALIIPILVNTFKRADNIAIAMELRGYKPGAVRTSLYRMEISRREVVFTTLVMISIITIAILL
jgi:energy-coupling factor transport system permease protein